MPVLSREENSERADRRMGEAEYNLCVFWFCELHCTCKKNGSYRLCVDYRSINKKIVKDQYPLPLIKDQLDQLQDANFFSILNLENSFFHVRMDEASIKYTSFIVSYGQYEFLQVAFDLCNLWFFNNLPMQISEIL